MNPRLGVLYDRDGNKCEILDGFANIAAGTTDGAIIPAKPGLKIAVLSIHAHAGATETTVTLNGKGTGAGTAITSTKSLSPYGGYIRTAVDNQAIYVTQPGEALTATTGAGSAIGIDLTYAYVRE